MRPSPGGAALPTRQELPPDIQRSLPPIVVSGTVYSSDPAQRLLVVNGELWHEGDQIRPDLVLEQIRRRDAVLRYRGLRFTVSP
jgi:general secretion pathway protein B